MSSNPYAHFSGIPMDSEEIDGLLEGKGFGVLSLCRDGQPYSIPISFGYDGDRIYFGFLEGEAESTKVEYIEDGATARLLVTDIRGRFDWQSIAVTGSVRALSRDDETEWDHFIETLVDNGWFMSAFERSDAIEALHGWELQMDELQGLERKEEVYE
jgi:nitroimidazol reductase NimA-like FMN-containing flavoprotein (pyridoxamine 5'-phosphate oxidase superfamily)